MTNRIVDAFAHERRWVVWRAEQVDGRETKVPYNPRGFKASSTHPRTWATLPEVAAARGYAGIGIVITYPILAVDLDDVVSGGRITDAASAEFVAQANSYTELSPSGAGLHVFLLLSAPVKLQRNRHGQYEAYTSARYFTITGRSWHDPSRPLRTVTPDEAERLLRILGYPWRRAPMRATIAPARDDDDALLARIERSAQGAKLRALLAGDATGYRSQSEADAALCCLLAWWTRDAAQIERVWLASRAGRRDKVREREDYRACTIQFALDRVMPWATTVRETNAREISLRAKLRRVAMRGAR